VIRTVEPQPWRGLSPAVADVIEPELGPITDEILVTIAREVPEYARPLEGSFGRGVRTGVSEALRQFVALIRDPAAGRGLGREVYEGLGRGELRQGRTIDALQSAYRVGARVAWRRIAAAARRAGLESDQLSLLAESIFAYIEEISADSVEGYTAAQAQVEGERRRRRRELGALLLREPPADPADVRAAADAGGWTVPRTVAALACSERELERLGHRLPVDTLALALDGVGCAIVPDPLGPGRERELAAASERGRAVLGPPAPLAELAGSWSLARAAWRAREAGALAAGTGLVHADDHLVEVLLHGNGALVEQMARRRLAPLEALTPKARARMRETALAYVEQHGNAAAMARALDVHPQTARYRLARLRELLGDDLDDPAARLELELALRAPSTEPAPPA
jgi:PucR C-terminal helix-turn-helix domain